LARRKHRSGLIRKVIAWLAAGIPVLLICGLISGMAGTLLGAYLRFSADLPDIPDLRAYRPKTVSTFYAEDGTVVGIFYKEKRFPVPLASLPPRVINAFLAAEDARFFSHPGLDLVGVLRAAVKNIEALKFVQGGSTITQQVVRYFLLSNERTMSRKIREAILSYRLEKSLSKKEILELYLNMIYLGNGAYGVESAARTFFGKNAEDLSIAEAAQLAGCVANPTRFSPTKRLKASIARRNRIVALMLQYGFITQDEYRKACAEEPALREKLPNPYERAPYFTEAVRQYIAAKYGEDRLYNEGLKVWTTCDLSLQGKASDALLLGARDWEKRRRRPIGLVKRLSAREAKSFLKTPSKKPYEVGDLVQVLVTANHTPKKRRNKEKKKDKNEPLIQECTLAFPGSLTFRMNLEGKNRYRPNDLLEFRITAKDGENLSVEQQTLPPIQGALVSIENRTGYVRALVGGLDFQRSRFNRAVQALRQPGSAFKPFVYSAALERSHYSPRTTILDEPIMVLVDQVQDEWIPLNSDGRFLGPITLRQALIHSRNTATVKLLMDVGIDSTIQMARDMGMKSPIGKHLSISLGASEVTPLEITSAYSVFPNLGMKVAPVLVKKVTDRYGNVLEDNTTEPLAVTPDALAKATAEGWGPRPMRHDYPVRQERDFQPRPYYDQYGRLRYGDPRYPHQDGNHREQAREMGQGPVEPTSDSDSQIWEIVEDPDRDYGPDELKPLSPKLDALLTGTGFYATGKVARRPENKRVMSPQTAYLMVSMLHDVCVSGTAGKVARMKRKDLGGKTGTTDDCTDAWFIGFNPTYTTGVWVGYDTKTSLGKKEYGNVAALPVWMSFMKEALSDKPEGAYPVPPSIAFVEDVWSQEFDDQGQRRVISGGPDFSPDIATKQISPLDSGVAPAAGYIDPATGMAMYPNHSGYPSGHTNSWYPQPGIQAHAPGSYPASVRVLSPTGETLGHAQYFMDDEGKLTVSRESMYPAHEYEEDLPEQQAGVPQQPHPQGEPFQHFIPQAQRIIRNLQRALPSLNPFEWH
jgi:penicillin-binding protein 1A